MYVALWLIAGAAAEELEGKSLTKKSESGEQRSASYTNAAASKTIAVHLSILIFPRLSANHESMVRVPEKAVPYYGNNYGYGGGGYNGYYGTGYGTGGYGMHGTNWNNGLYGNGYG